MKLSTRLLLIVSALCMVFFCTSCEKKSSKNEKSKSDTDTIKTVTMTKEDTPVADDIPNDTTNLSDEESVQKAKDTITAYVDAAKKLDFDTMDKYISDSKVLPILNSYTEAYSKYGISDSRIKELSKARLGTYHISVLNAKKSSSGVDVTVKIARPNMESLQNKWLEILCNEYPEYTTLTDEQMNSKTVDVLIQVMIDVLKNSEPVVEEEKNFTVENKNGSWIIKAKNEDFFPTN